jgi:hypothetical protein
VLLPDGFLVIWRLGDKRGTTARLARHTRPATPCGPTALPFNEISYPGVVEMSPRAVRNTADEAVAPGHGARGRPRRCSSAGDRVLAHLIDVPQRHRRLLPARPRPPVI